MREKDDLEGMILYTIENDDCLNGVYTNMKDAGVLFNDIEKRIKKFGDDRIAGVYLSSWIENSESDEIYVRNGTLTIDLKNSTGEYDFQWSVNKNLVFEGVGYIMNNNQLAVSYWDVNE